MRPKVNIFLKGLLLSSVMPFVVPLHVHAEEARDEMQNFEEIVSVGTRRKGRTVTQSIAPVDVFNAEALESSGYTDMNDMLRTLVPSFNIKRNATNDGTMLVRPFTMKGSPPDHVLLLLNGKRRHKSALVQLSGGYNTAGSQGPDMGQLPSIAFKDIQILRDGASAQYGSDAIAGVVNMSMKTASEGGSVVASYGQFYEGDGENIDIAANIGLPLSANGYLNLSAQYVNQSKTDRSIQTTGAAELEALGYQGVPNPAMVWGNPTHEGLRTAWNGGLNLSDTMEAYFFGNFAHSTSAGGFWYRNPTGGGAYGESNFDESVAHPGVFDLTETYPGGFTPQFGATVHDFSQVIGVNGETKHNLTWDASFRYGRSDIDYNIKNTINPSMGNESPTEFLPGSLAQKEVQVNLDLSYPIKNNIFSDDIVVSGGAEWRKESYIIGAGDPASYEQGPLKDLPIGSNGFPGYGPDQAGTFSRKNYSGYIDFETNVTEDWSVALAGRFEDYSDFGSTANYKVGMRYSITDNFALRGSMSSGFRAPSVGQLYTKNVSTDFSGDAIPVAIVSGLYPNGSVPAQYYGAGKLTPESSTNYAFGFVYTNNSGSSLTVDFYQIDITDRMLLAGPYSVTDADRTALTALGVRDSASLGQVRFFKNLFNTRTKGVDVVATHKFEWEGEASTDVTLAVNYNDQKLTKFNASDFGISSKKNYEDGVPATKGNLTINHHLDSFDFMVRANYYGTAFQGSNDGNHLEFKPAVLLDLEVTYHVTEEIDITLSGRNVLDKYPGSYNAEAWGMPFWSRSPYGYNGGYYSAKIKYNF
ncbi:TonB-dependent receptor plug domain-containing protein [Paremcibacter congregatus]|uniref:TonB-dependent receptor plug domain-containing protein n=1 Tax=Paremcibacter congregatus TaxID=2043170 RepID=UPI003A90BD5C